MSFIQLENIKKRYGKTQTIHGISLDIVEGDFVVFVGPSGCGKSTLLRMIAGLEEVTEGNISIAGNDVTHAIRPLSAHDSGRKFKLRHAHAWRE